MKRGKQLRHSILGNILLLLLVLMVGLISVNCDLECFTLLPIHALLYMCFEWRTASHKEEH